MLITKANSFTLARPMNYQVILRACIMIVTVMVSHFASADGIVWDGKKSFMEIADKVSIMEDAGGKLTIDEVSKASMSTRFKPSDQHVLNFGISESFFWLKFSFSNPTEQTLWLEMAQAFLPSADLYYKGEDGKWKTSYAGYNIEIEEKAVKSHFQVFPLPAGQHDFYLRFQSFSPPTPVRIWHHEKYEVQANRQKIIYGLYAGVLLFVVVNNILLFFSFRRFSYLHYAVVVLIYMATTAAVSEGYLPYIVSKPDMMYWYRVIPQINMPVLWLYCVYFLEVKKYLPAFYKIALAIFAYYILTIVVCHFLPISQTLLLNQINAVSLFALIVGMSIHVRRKGNIFGYYLAVTYLVFCFFVVLEATYIQTGFPPYLFGISHTSVALLIEVFFLSYLLSKRFEWEKKEIENERTDARQKLLEKTIENEKIVKEQNISLEQKVNERTAELNQSLTDLRVLQNQLIQAEKMASLGELTAGIAHEIQNPLNFVNNFSEVSTELLDEIKEERLKGDKRDETVEEELLGDLADNLVKITHHGKRADSIVKGMLEHSRAGSGEKEMTDLNALADEYLRLSYHGLRAKDKSFNSEFVVDLDPKLGKVRVVSQDLGRVLLNLINNAFYAVNELRQTDPGFRPLVSVTTKCNPGEVQIRVKDNGAGIPQTIRQKIFQPFFSTKPTGQGTGLGLSLSYEIIVNGHNGRFEVESVEGKGSEFIVSLPIT